MRKLAFLVLIMAVSNVGISQVEQLIYLKNGQQSKVEYVGQTGEEINVIPIKKKEIVSLSKNEISQIQTLGVYFLYDEYDDYLSMGKKVLGYTTLGSSNKYDLEVAGRINNDTIVLSVRLVFNEFIGEGIYIFEGDNLSIQLVSGENILLSLNRAYYTSEKDLKYGFLNTHNVREDINYNISYLKLNQGDINKLINSPIETLHLKDQKIRIKDEFCIMRHLLALMDEKWSY